MELTAFGDRDCDNNNPPDCGIYYSEADTGCMYYWYGKMTDDSNLGCENQLATTDARGGTILRDVKVMFESGCIGQQMFVMLSVMGQLVNNADVWKVKGFTTVTM